MYNLGVDTPMCNYTPKSTFYMTMTSFLRDLHVTDSSCHVTMTCYHVLFRVGCNPSRSTSLLGFIMDSKCTTYTKCMPRALTSHPRDHTHVTWPHDQVTWPWHHYDDITLPYDPHVTVTWPGDQKVDFGYPNAETLLLTYLCRIPSTWKANRCLWLMKIQSFSFKIV